MTPSVLTLPVASAGMYSWAPVLQLADPDWLDALWAREELGASARGRDRRLP